MTSSTAPSLLVAGADAYVIEVTMCSHLSVCANKIVTPSLAHLRLTVSLVLSLTCAPSLSLLLSLHLLSPSISPLSLSCVRAYSLLRLLLRLARHFSLPLSFFLSLSCTAHTHTLVHVYTLSYIHTLSLMFAGNSAEDGHAERATSQDNSHTYLDVQMIHKIKTKRTETVSSDR